MSGPDWLRTQRFDIAAKLPERTPGRSARDLFPEMLQSLLADRFKLVIHRETREQTVLALVVTKGGAKLQPAAPDADAPIPETDGSLVNTALAEVIRIRKIQTLPHTPHCEPYKQFVAPHPC